MVVAAGKCVCSTLGKIRATFDCAIRSETGELLSDASDTERNLGAYRKVEVSTRVCSARPLTDVDHSFQLPTELIVETSSQPSGNTWRDATSSTSIMSQQPFRCPAQKWSSLSIVGRHKPSRFFIALVFAHVLLGLLLQNDLHRTFQS